MLERFDHDNEVQEARKAKKKVLEAEMKLALDKQV